MNTKLSLKSISRSVTDDVAGSDANSASATRVPASPAVDDAVLVANPFNGVKLELGFSLLLGVLLWLGANSITADASTQWLILFGYAFVSMAWLMLRTRQVVRRCANIPSAEHSANMPSNCE
jgi:hypothetical protein